MKLVKRISVFGKLLRLADEHIGSCCALHPGMARLALGEKPKTRRAA